MIDYIYIPPAFIFILASLLIPFLKREIRKIYLLLIPTIVFTQLLYLKEGVLFTYHFLGYNLILLKVDKLSLCFGYVFVIISFATLIYSLHVKEAGQHMAAFLHIGSGLGVVFAGDLFSLFIFWELMAIGGCLLIIYQKEKKAIDAGLRYIMVHLFGGGCLLAGIVIHLTTNNSIAFEQLSYPSLSSLLILIAFIINAAVPPLHAWLADAYPEATITGAVFLTAYVTKSGVYVLIRAFSGVELLMWLGAIMAVYGVIFAALENDIRRLLAYHIISQVGYMVCGVGLGTKLAINGSTAHAFCHILYKALLFMGAGAVIYSTGRRKLSDLQGCGLYKMMPVTLILYIIGAFSISGVPLFNGFISKSVTVTAAEMAHQSIVYLMLTLASIGTFLSVNLKLPYFTWFGNGHISQPQKIEAREAPLNMILGMSLLAFLCIFSGCYPKIIYSILPYPIEYHPYTAHHIIGTIALLLWTGFIFKLFIKKLTGKETITLDTDWFYRKAGNYFIWFCNYPLTNLEKKLQKIFSDITNFIASIIKNSIIINEDIYRRPIGVGILLAILFLFFYILIRMITA